VSMTDVSGLPGASLVERGLADLRDGRRSVEGLLVLIGAPRLRRAGIAVPAVGVPDPERSLYELLQRDHGDAAHSRYNALVRRLVSFERALECSGIPAEVRATKTEDR
jgi:hypothetical protein